MSGIHTWRPRRSALEDLLVLSLVLVAGAIYYVVRWGSVQELVHAIDHARVLFADFVARFHPVASDFFESGRVYPGFYYSAFFVLLIAPLGTLSPGPAAVVWGVLQGVFVLLLFLIPAHTLLARSRRGFWLYAVLVTTSVPVVHNLVWGQVSVPLATGVLGTLVLYRGGRRVLAATTLALTVAVKFYTVIFLAYFLIKRDGRFVGAFAAATVALAVVLPALALGPKRTVDFYGQIASNLAEDRGRIATGVSSQYLPVVAERWVQWAKGDQAPLPVETSLLRSALRPVGVAVAAFQMLLVLVVVRRKVADEAVWAFALLAGALPFVVPTSWPHYFAHIHFFQAWAVADLRFDARSPMRSTGPTLLLAASMVLSSLLAFELAGAWRPYAYLGALFLSNLTLLVVLDGWALSRRPDR